MQSTDLSSNENQRETGVVQQDNDTRKQPNPKNGEQGIAKKGSTITHDAENHQDKILNRDNLNKESTGEVSTGEEVSSIFSEAIPSSKKQ
ncbi:hypothetical protein RQP50_13965 [Paenibacillus sp. chi10]|uniref:Uncharacterized protein n=1 Tax=Paenibacillus suaedae TaxID=3077233 RepID=A0AAJ2N2B8_9BACL|nr:hypothetical protein [Paenibacillus sp. chi10]MDT8977338.1 hypothetical protein [Paenibacillus sp. chi10]